MKKGIYCLILRNPNCSIRVGALGEISFRPGYHSYVGSARGAGGFARVRRHIQLAKHKEKAPRWHIDYLLLDENFSLTDVICAETTLNLECILACLMPGEPVPGFGCSDCNCTSHLFFCPQSPLNAAKKTFSEAGYEKYQVYTHHIAQNP